MPVSNRPTEPVPYWRSECGRATIYVGDCREVLAQLAPGQFHAVVTDPPYGLEFMGKEWDAPWKNQGVTETVEEGTDQSHPFRDGTQRVRYGNTRTRKVDARDRRAAEMSDYVRAKYLSHNVEYVRDSHLYQEWFAERAAEILRVAKPGAHLLSFGGTRMWHRMACAIEDAGWEIRDTVMWLYGSGFPKSMDISKAIDRMHGVEREAVGRSSSGLGAGQFTTAAGVDGGYGFKNEYDVTEPATEDAKIWRGWGTSLKPAWEPVIVARRPLAGTAAECSLEHGCGGINVDACRVGTEGGSRAIEGSEPDYLNNVYGTGMGGNPKDPNYKAGRWPANVVHDGSEEVVELFPDTGGSRSERTGVRGGSSWHGQDGIGTPDGVGTWPADQGGSAARFFYTAKANGDRDRPHAKGSTTHPTVKPLDLMRYLVRLVCVRGGTVLDPFMGSGSTGCAALEEGMAFVGVEQSQEYADIAVGRLKLALQRVPADYAPPVTRAPQRSAGDAPKPKRMR